MLFQNRDLTSGVFITFSGNCRKALTFYQTCFGGTLHFQTFGKELHGYAQIPVINGSLISDSIAIHGSDLVHNEGRKAGNYLSIFLLCKDANSRNILIGKLQSGKKALFNKNNQEQRLIEVIDGFDVRWVLAF
jgi:uncharacterized glyoxalase superfamily protein PhnB